MSRISIEELKRQPEEQWVQQDEIIVTSHGKPIAVLLPTSDDVLGSTLAALRSLRALQAQASLQRSAAQTGQNRMSADEIDAEIAEVRNSRRK